MLIQLKRVLSRLRFTQPLIVGMLIAVAQPLSAQNPMHRPTKWEVGLTPTVQIISGDLAGDHVWGGGLTASATYRRDQMFAINASLLGAFAPQLNFKNSSPLNSVQGTLSGEFHLRTIRPWDPYVSLGIGNELFQYANPPVGYEKLQSYAFMHGAIGVRYALTHRLNWRAEIGRQFSGFGASPTFMSGLSLRIRDKEGK